MNTEGIVLNGFPIRENDKIIKVFTKDLGIIAIYCQNIFDSKNPYKNTCDIFAHSAFEIKKTKDMYQLIDAENIHYFTPLRSDFSKSIFANLCMELMDRIIYDDYTEPILFELLKKYLLTLQTIQETQHEIITTAFMLKSSAFLGIKPVTSIREKLDYYYFSISDGGLNGSENGFLLSFYEVKVLNDILYSTFEEILEFNISESISYKLFTIALEYLKYNFGIMKLNSELFFKYVVRR